jgi:hypothetical protein
MSTVSLTQNAPIVNLSSLEVIIIRAYDRRDEWTIEVTFTGGAVVSMPFTAEEVSQIETELKVTPGWRVNPSLYCNGFSARRMTEREQRVTGLLAEIEAEVNEKLAGVNGLCVSCQFGNHCGNCVCCRGKAIPNSWYNVNRGEFTASVDRETNEVSYKDE